MPESEDLPVYNARKQLPGTGSVQGSCCHGSSLQERLIRRSGFMCAHKTAITVSPLSYVYLASEYTWIGACQFNLCVFCKTGQSSPWLSEGTLIEHQVPSDFSVLSDRTSVFHNHIWYPRSHITHMKPQFLRLYFVLGQSADTY